MNTYSGVRSSRPAGFFSFGLLDGLSVRLCRPYGRETPAGFGLTRLATAFMNNPGQSMLNRPVLGGRPAFAISGLDRRCCRETVRCCHVRKGRPEVG